MNWKGLYQLQKELHQYPELSFEEHRTTTTIKKAVELMGLSWQDFANVKTGGYAEIGAGKTILFRADIDALPIQESPLHEPRSRKPGVMHACGHDFHTTIGVGLLQYLQTEFRDLPGKLRVVFQPAEEAAPGGGPLVAKEAIWQDVAAALAVHVSPKYPCGSVVIHRQGVQAASTTIEILISGPGGHTAQSNLRVNLIKVAAQFINQLHKYVDMLYPPQETVAFAFGEIHGGNAHNTIPEQILLRGTLRTFDNQLSERLRAAIINFSQRFSAQQDFSITVSYPNHCPAVINNTRLVDLFLKFNEQSPTPFPLYSEEPPSLGADDFSFYLQKAPGLYLILGAAGKGALHTAELELCPQIIEKAVKHLASFIQFLWQNNHQDQE